MHDGTLTLGGDRPRNDVVAKGDERDGNTHWGGLVKSTNAGDLKLEGGRDPPPPGTQTSRGLTSGGWSDVSGRNPLGGGFTPNPGRKGGETGRGAVPTAAATVSPRGEMK